MVTICSTSCALRIPGDLIVTRESPLLMRMLGCEEQIGPPFVYDLRPHLLFTGRKQPERGGFDVRVAFVVRWSANVPDRITRKRLAEVDRQVSSTVGTVQLRPLSTRRRSGRRVAHTLYGTCASDMFELGMVHGRLESIQDERTLNGGTGPVSRPRSPGRCGRRRRCGGSRRTRSPRRQTGLPLPRAGVRGARRLGRPGRMRGCGQPDCWTVALSITPLPTT